MIAIQFDIWGNVTSISDGNGPWSFKQLFFEDELLRYEDNLGNYWTKEYGDFPFKMVKFKERDEPYLGLFTLNFNIKCDDDEIIYSIITYFGFSSKLTIMPETVASDLVPVTPMDAPIGQLFYVDYIYEKKESWLQKIKSKINLVMSKIYCIFVKDKLKIIKL
jgi:hypothetical protein